MCNNVTVLCLCRPGTPSIVDCGTVWLSCVIELSSRSHIPQDGYLQNSLITVGLSRGICGLHGLMIVEHSSLIVTYYQPTGQ